MGYGLLKDLTAQPQIDEVVAADINIVQAKRFAEGVGSNKIEVRRCDVTYKQETVRLMNEGFDVIASALPRPFCDAAVAAAIEAGVGYADVAASFATIFDQDARAENNHHRESRQASLTPNYRSRETRSYEQNYLV